MSDVINDNTPPKPASPKAPLIPKILGWGGVIPFILCGVASRSGDPDLMLYGLYGGTNYAAVILSFLGAVHWGLAMGSKRSDGWFIWSITPALLAAASLLIFDAQMRVWTLIPLFVMAWGVDYSAARQGLVPDWYMPLRTGLTLGAIVGLGLMIN